MPPPARRDIINVIQELESRVARLERSQNALGLSFPFPDVDTEPDPPASGVIVYAFGGVLKAVQANGTRGNLL